MDVEALVLKVMIKLLVPAPAAASLDLYSGIVPIRQGLYCIVKKILALNSGVSVRS